MNQVQVRLNSGLVRRVDQLVRIGIYNTRSDVIRDAVRRLVLDKMIGILPDTGNSVREVREIRKKLSRKFKGFKDVEKINKLSFSFFFIFKEFS